MKNNKIVSSLLCCAAIFIVSGTGRLCSMEDANKVPVCSQENTSTVDEQDSLDTKELLALLKKRDEGKPLTDTESSKLNKYCRLLMMMFTAKGC